MTDEQRKILSQIDTDDLTNELRGRYAHCAIIWLDELDMNNEAACFDWQGGRYTVLGLLHDSTDRLLEAGRSTSDTTDLDEDES